MSSDEDQLDYQPTIPSTRNKRHSLLTQSRPTNSDSNSDVFLCNDTLISLYALACKAQVNFSYELPMALEAWQVDETNDLPRRYFLIDTNSKRSSVRFSCVGKYAVESLGLRPLGKEDLRLDATNQAGLVDENSNEGSTVWVRAWGRGIQLGGLKSAKDRLEILEALDPTPPIGPSFLSTSPSPGFLLTVNVPQDSLRPSF